MIGHKSGFCSHADIALVQYGTSLQERERERELELVGTQHSPTHRTHTQHAYTTYIERDKQNDRQRETDTRNGTASGRYMS